jgi:ribosome-binding ATPase YchF (GTP1/OBG family)
MAQLNEGKPVRALDLSKEEKANLRQFFLITAKPVLYVANVKEGGFENNPHLDAVRAHAEKEGADVVAVCAAIEAEIADLADDEKQMFLADMGLDEPGLNRLIRAGYTCWACRPTSPPGSRKCAPGPSTRAIPRRRPPA